MADIMNLIKVNVNGGIEFNPILVNDAAGAPMSIPNININRALVLSLIELLFLLS